MPIIGLTGKRGCGKDTAAKYLLEKYDFKMLDFTKDVLAPILVQQGKPVTRENLIDIAMLGRKKSHNGIWAEKLCANIKQRAGKDFVISGVRFREEVKVFKQDFKDDFKLVAIICDDRLRYARVKKRGTKNEADISFEKFMKTEKKETERVIAGTMKIADFAIDNNRTLDDMYKEVDEVMKILKRLCR